MAMRPEVNISNAEMTRVSLGHTGRPLRLPSGLALAYKALFIAALFRVMAALGIVPYLSSLALAASLWCSAFVIFLYLYLIYRMMRTTIKANSQFYTFIAGGLTMMLLFHIFENIGATTGILPLTGIPLPFISQGGSNLISNIIGIGLILSIKYNEETPERKGKTRNKYRRKLARRMEESERRNQREERMSQSANNGSARMTRTRS